MPHVIYTCQYVKHGFSQLMYISFVRQQVFGDFIRRIRESKHLSLRDVERLCKKDRNFSISAQALGSIERGDFTTTSFDTIILLHHVLNVPLKDLLQAYSGKVPGDATTPTPHPASTEALATRVIQDLDQMSKHVKQLLQAQGIATQGPTEPPPKA